MSEPVDLDGIEALADEAWRQSDREAPLDLVGAARALVAEVRALRAKVAAVQEIVEDGPWFCVDFHGEVEAVDAAELRRALSDELA